MFEPFIPKYKNEIIELIDTIYREYNDVVCLTGCDKDLEALDKFFAEPNGNFWVYKMNNKIVGTVAVKIVNNAVEMKRFYLKKEFRGTGIANKLLQKAEEWTVGKEYLKLFFWSDTRFERAHNYYKKMGFVQKGIREMNDGNIPYSEFYFEKELQ